LANQPAKSCCCDKAHPVSLQDLAVDPDPEDALFKMIKQLFAMPGKDVIFELSDGEEKAHKLILMAGSEVFQGMLQSGLSEGVTQKIVLLDIDCVTMRVFLRLMYTAHADPGDWFKTHADTEHKGKADWDVVLLTVVLNVVVLVKKYMVKFLEDLTTQTLIKRLILTLETLDSIDLYDRTMSGIIKNGIRPVLTAGLNAAKGNAALRAKFNATELSPEVQYELSAFWGAPALRSKRARFAELGEN
jgi:hypothetical protein